MKRVILACLFACASVAQADVSLPAIFADHAVLQRGKPVPVWGKASPGERVSVTLGTTTGEATADDQGAWRVDLAALPAGGPFELVVQGNNRVSLADVYVGEVWLCSGQSNMDFSVSAKDRKWAGTLNEAAEIANANHPKIREFRVPLGTADEPQTDVKATWKVCGPDTVGDFSAPAYFFAREYQKTHDVPVGLVTSAFGASTAQAWIRRESIAAAPELASMLDAYAKACADWASGAAKTNYDSAIAAWTTASEKAKADGKPAPRKPGQPRDPHKDQHNPTLCYNAMIAPLHPYAVKGVLWYQGESNGYNSQLYQSLMTTLINDWRARWGEPLPFIQVQLAGHKAPATQPVANSQIANVREAQRLSSQLPGCALVTAVDIGDERDVHPKNKQEVGRRLALAARAVAYGEAIEWSGPTLSSASIQGDVLGVRFDHARGLTVRAGDTSVKGFTLLGADGKWRFADAEVDGDSVTIKLAPGERPTEVRYAWADNPVANLVNGEGLPAIPFRSPLSE